jgi:hypothetical protein
VNSLPILIIGAPAVLAVIAFKKAQKDEKIQDRKPERVEAFQWPPKWNRFAKTGNR